MTRIKDKRLKTLLFIYLDSWQECWSTVGYRKDKKKIERCCKHCHLSACSKNVKERKKERKKVCFVNSLLGQISSASIVPVPSQTNMLAER